MTVTPAIAAAALPAESSPALPEDPQRIIVLRPDHLGDLILFSGSLRQIRNRWPSAHITLCVRSYGRALFAHCPYVDELLPYEPFRWIGKIPWPGWLADHHPVGRFLHSALTAGLRVPGYDLAILAQIAPWVNHHRIMQILPAGSRVGTCGNSENQSSDHDGRNRRLYSHQLDISKWPRGLAELEANRLFLSFLGIELAPSANAPEFWTLPAHSAKAASLVVRTPGQRILGIAPGVSSPAGKRLPASWFAQVLQAMPDENLHLVLLGSPADAPACAELESQLGQLGGKYTIANLAGKTSVLELIECIRCCDLLLCNDAAPLHVAAGLSKPVVGIMGGGHFGRFYPWGSPKTSRMVHHPMDCYGCNWECKYDTLRCIQEIPPTDAAKELLHLLGALPEADLQSHSDHRDSNPVHALPGL